MQHSIQLVSFSNNESNPGLLKSQTKGMIMLHLKKATRDLALTVALASMSLTACSPNQSGEVDTRLINLASIMDVTHLTPEQKAEELALAAEQLATPSSFMYAYSVSQTALTFDSKNVRARFWAAALAPTMELKGIYTRIEPLVRTNPDHYLDYVRWTTDLKRTTPEKSVRDFLFGGPSDIQTEREAQEVIARFTVRVDEFRNLMKELKNEVLVLNINDSAFQKEGLQDAAQKTCTVQQVGPYSYEWTNCDFTRAYQVRLNQADFEGLQVAAAGIQTYITLLNSRDITGLYSKAALLEKESPHRALETLLEDPRFGTLRTDHGLGVIPDSIRDAVLGARYAVKMQDKLCRTGRAQPSNRPGHLFQDGFCITQTPSVPRFLSTVEASLSGSPITFVIQSPNNSSAAVTINPVKFFETPLQDLRSLQPETYNWCGEISGLADGTFGGLFPTGDLNSYLSESATTRCLEKSFGNSSLDSI